MRNKFLKIAGCAVLALWVSPVQATMVLERQFADTVSLARHIVHVRVMDTRGVLANGGQMVNTLVDFKIVENLKGDKNSGDLLTLTFGGGSIPGGDSVLVAGMPEFTKEKEYILFIAEEPNALCPLVGWGTGRYIVESDEAGRPYVTDNDGSVVVGFEGDRPRIALDQYDRVPSSVLQNTPENTIPDVQSNFESRGYVPISLEEFKKNISTIVRRRAD